MRDPNILDIKSRLIEHAAMLVTGKLLPHIDTEHWYRSTPMAERRQITDAMEAAADRHRELAIQIRDLANRLSVEQLPLPQSEKQE